MVERDVVLAKIATVDRCLDRITEVRSRGDPALRPLDVEDICLINLLRAVQATIDLATHVIATERYGLPDSLAASFTLLEKNAVIDAQLADRLRKMTGFRNIAVHQYQEVDPAVIEAILSRHLDDLRSFSRVVVQRFLSDPD